MSSIQHKYDALLKEHITLEVKYNFLDERLKKCEESCKQLRKDILRKEIDLLRQQVKFWSK